MHPKTETKFKISSNYINPQYGAISILKIIKNFIAKKILPQPGFELGISLVFRDRRLIQFEILFIEIFNILLNKIYNIETGNIQRNLQ